MKKSFMLFFTLFLGLISLFALTGCTLINSVTPFSYVSYELSDDQVAYYSNSVYGTHIFIFEDETMMPDGNLEIYNDNLSQYLIDCDANSIINIEFKRILGVEEVNGKKASLVEIDDWYYIEVTIKKDSSIYSSNKNIYLNGNKLEISNSNDVIYDYDNIIIYHFDDCGLERSNPKGKINDTVNIIEYK